MTSFKIINDDVAVRSLKESNKTPAVSNPVAPVKASTPVQKSPENTALNIRPSDHRKGKAHTELRHHIDRRKRNNPVLLDTRSQHERRIKHEKKDDTGNESITVKGIDEVI